MHLQDLYPALPRYEYINKRNGPVRLGNVVPSPHTLKKCTHDGDSDCYYRCGAGNGTRWVGPGPDQEHGEYVFRTQMAAIANDLRFADDRRRPFDYRGPVDGMIGSYDPRNETNMHVGGLPKTFGEKYREEKFLPRQVAAERAVLFTNVNTAQSFPFVPAFR